MTGKLAVLVYIHYRGSISVSSGRCESSIIQGLRVILVSKKDSDAQNRTGRFSQLDGREMR